MTLRVLQNFEENLAARRTLIERGWSMLPPARLMRLRRWLRRPETGIGDIRKSWDVLTAAQWVLEHCEKDGPVLDLGAYQSELLGVLHRAGMRRLSGVDLNPDLVSSPLAGDVDFTVGDFMDTGLPDASFEAITAISVIEHGYNPHPLLREVSRLLRPGGLFICSTDYWPDPIDTGGTEVFGMSWTLFSAEELQRFIDLAVEYGLEPTGTLEFEADRPDIHFSGFDYTFALLALEKVSEGRDG